jgi:hypothetical protein
MTSPLDVSALITIVTVDGVKVWYWSLQQAFDHRISWPARLLLDWIVLW